MLDDPDGASTGWATARKRSTLCSLALLSAISVLSSSNQSEAQDAAVVAGAKAERPIADFTLRDFAGKPFTLADWKQKKCVVVVFFGTECPLARLYAPRLQTLADDYRARGVAVIGIDSNAQDSITDMAAYARLHKIDFPLLKDPGAAVADQFGARRTPEAYVLDERRMVRYRGRIDDQYGVGTMRPKPKRNDLRVALDELLAGKEVSQPLTDAAGCLIGRPRKRDEKSPVTFSKQISRIFNHRCVECHRPGEIGPFALTDYQEVAGWADTIGEVVAADRMPPWHANPKFGRFAGDRTLTAEEKQLIAQWVAAGAPEGNREERPKSPEFLASGWQLARQPDVIIPMSATPFKVPAEGPLDYQFFAIDSGYEEDKWLVAAEVMPGNRAVVHHVMVFAITAGSIEALTDQTPTGYLAAYVPGMRATSYPAGMAKRIPAGSRLIFQVHYAPNGSEQLDCTKLGLLFTDPKSVRYEVLTGNVMRHSIVIPPRTARYRVAAKSIRSTEGSYLLSMMAHMHLRGAAFNYQLIYPNGKIETLLDIPHYDSKWQTSYRLLEPLPLPTGSQLRCTAVFDNSEDNLNNPDPSKTVRWGLQERDEMMVGYFDIAVPHH
jgi:peroxiredoxin